MKKLFLVIMALALLLVTGCAKDSLSSQQQGSGYTVVDARGKKVTFASAPKRIVCLNYSATDILTDLIPTDRIIATDMWAREEDLSNCYEKLKGIPVCENNPEQIMKFKPDIVTMDITMPKLDGIDAVSEILKINPAAKKFDTLSIQEVVDRKLGVIDMTASVMCMENRMPLVIFGLNKENSIVDTVAGKIDGTVVTA
mgnify:CR=1 FL=1